MVQCGIQGLAYIARLLRIGGIYDVPRKLARLTQVCPTCRTGKEIGAVKPNPRIWQRVKVKLRPCHFIRGKIEPVELSQNQRLH
jgi:hypothetical protein